MLSRKDLAELIDSERHAHLSFLQSLIRTPSANPPGDTREAVKVVQQYLTKNSIQSELIAPKPEAPNLVSLLQEDDTQRLGRRLVLNGHIDHFPISDRSQWHSDPYSGHIKDGFVHGCGAVDMKAGTAASIIAFSYMHRFRTQLLGQCALEVVSDEETGGRFGTRYLLEQDGRKETWKGDCMLNAEPGGLDSIRFGEKGTLRMTFRVDTQGGHGAYTHRDEGAIRIAARLIDRLVALEGLRGEGMDAKLQDYLQRPDVRRVADRIMGSGAADSMLKPTVNIGTIIGGAKVNMIPASCVFEVDVRLPVSLEAETVLGKIDRILSDVPEASYTVQDAATNPAAASSIDHALVDLIQRNAGCVRGTKPLPICSLGATDCKHFRYHGIPAYSYGASPETMAQKNERVSVQDFLDTVKVHTLVAWDYLSG
ncbi:hypothetical protein LTR36_007841 [Oleoguttula mirabilis]|uniref:Peptidase M20 dimerisation domain-containing protein n=1 Tax=Oleoguttula mirabilis TaxID=1507867 RepID=A0AAV9J988_9PEZI|nr:hypothetical protein LTR36_007841 [Oleoguttula mirabilis]